MLVAKSEREKKAARYQLTAERLAASSELHVGMKIANHRFETLKGDSTDLYSEVTGAGVMVVIHPECSSCVEELVRLKTIGPSQTGVRELLFVSYGNPRLLQDLWKDIGIGFTILYDHRAEWCKHNNVQDFPLVIKFDDDFVIQDIYIGGLLEEDVAELHL